MELREVEFQGRRHVLKTDTVFMEAQATKKQDAKRVAIGTGVGGIVGGLLGGKKGIAKGAAIGGSAGGVGVFVTKGREVELSEESPIYFTLRDDLELQVSPSGKPSSQ